MADAHETIPADVDPIIAETARRILAATVSDAERSADVARGFDIVTSKVRSYADQADSGTTDTVFVEDWTVTDLGVQVVRREPADWLEQLDLEPFVPADRLEELHKKRLQITAALMDMKLSEHAGVTVNG